MPRAGFEPAIPATKRPQSYALDRAVTGIGFINKSLKLIIVKIETFWLLWFAGHDLGCERREMRTTFWWWSLMDCRRIDLGIIKYVVMICGGWKWLMVVSNDGLWYLWSSSLVLYYQRFIYFTSWLVSHLFSCHKCNKIIYLKFRRQNFNYANHGGPTFFSWVNKIFPVGPLSEEISPGNFLNKN
jgi:hypothetical protein